MDGSNPSGDSEVSGKGCIHPERGGPPVFRAAAVMQLIWRRAPELAIVGDQVDDPLGSGMKGIDVQDFSDGVWLNKPTQFDLSEDGLRVVTDGETDFWRETHYGFTRDNGHFFGLEAPDCFTAQLRVRASFEHLYDQAGIMVRLDERKWIKAGLEFSDGNALLGSVLTDERSDWATGAFAGDPMDFWMRVSLADGVLRLQASTDGKLWPLVRLSAFPKSTHYKVGPMCCTPERSGLSVMFSDWKLSGHLGKSLHDLT